MFRVRGTEALCELEISVGRIKLCSPNLSHSGANFLITDPAVRQGPTCKVTQRHSFSPVSIIILEKDCHRGKASVPGSIDSNRASSHTCVNSSYEEPLGRRTVGGPGAAVLRAAPLPLF